MRVIDTYNEIKLLFSQKEFNLELWQKYANSISPSLRQKVESDASAYDLAKQVFPVINYALNNITKLEEMHNSFISTTQQLKNTFIEVFKNDLDVDIILYLGLCNGAGWATSLDGKKTILLGVEKIIELDWCDFESMSSLIYHELGHIWHDVVGNLSLKTENQSEKSVWQLYQEGVAMYCEQLLANNFSFYHQNKDEWLKWCVENKDNLFTEYLRRVDNGESTQDFFGDWCNYQGYSDVGYYLGCEFVKRLLKKYSLTEIANLSIETLSYELQRYK